MPRAIPILSEFHNLSAGDLADQLGTLKAEIADLEARKRTIAGELIRRGVSEAEGALLRSLVVAETMVSRIDRQGIEKFRTLSRRTDCLGAWMTMLASPAQSPEWRGTPA
jgi:hypothetical protein